MSERLYVATRKGLFEVKRARGKWSLGEPWFLGDPVTAVLPDARDGTLYAALNLGHFGVKMRRSRDGGRSWEEHAVPTYPVQPEGAEGPAWKLVQVWVMETGGRDQPGALWAGTIPGGLFRSNDRGDTWTLQRSLWDRPERLGWFGGGYDSPGIHSICVESNDSRRLTLGISSGGVWRSEDGGETWRLRGEGLEAEYMPPERVRDPNIQDVHRLVQCAASPDAMWLQHHCAAYRSADRGATFSAIPEPALSRFGFAVAVHPREPDTAWFVPAVKDEKRVPVNAEFAATRTRDGGRTFEVLREGLPAAPAYDLVYRHGLDVDESGERLAIGSTTGGLWLSENGGDTWQCISTHLPPINAVRFSA